MVIRSRHQRFAIDRNHLTVILRAGARLILRAGARQPSAVPLLDSRDSSSGIFLQVRIETNFLQNFAKRRHHQCALKA